MYRAQESWTRRAHLFAIATLVGCNGGDLHVILFCVLAFSSFGFDFGRNNCQCKLSVSDSFFLCPRNSSEAPLFRYLLIATEVEKVLLHKINCAHWTIALYLLCHRRENERWCGCENDKERELCEYCCGCVTASMLNGKSFTIFGRVLCNRRKEYFFFLHIQFLIEHFSRHLKFIDWFIN